MKRIWRRVSYHLICQATHLKHPRPVVLLALECGHKDIRPVYVKVPRRVICLHCEIERI